MEVSDTRQTEEGGEQMLPAQRQTMPLMSGEMVDALLDPDQVQHQQRLAEAYDQACRALLGPNDVQEADGREFKKKSAWRKLQRRFAISTKVVSAETWWVEDEDEIRQCVSRVVVRATAPWGQYAEAVGKCSTRERRFYWEDSAGNLRPNDKARMKADHDCESTAQTRASNRAISDLIAAGEVSAEEIEGGDVYEGSHRQRRSGGESNGDRDVPVLDRTLPRGKYKDKTWGELVEEDRGYVHWALENTDWLSIEDSNIVSKALAGDDSQGDMFGDTEEAEYEDVPPPEDDATLAAGDPAPEEMKGRLLSAWGSIAAKAKVNDTDTAQSLFTTWLRATLVDVERIDDLTVGEASSLLRMLSQNASDALDFIRRKMG